ncbi:hypothetical protein AB0F88_37080 [Streptosporangium sp. NPDC023963]|uniref:hypothetical protein n=1 Tax=Streptosporangium sp. NPDC023963 TaxID=3155608 RepID=UPI003416386D
MPTTRMPCGMPNMCSQAWAMTLDQRCVATWANRAEAVSVSTAGGRDGARGGEGGV